MDIELKRKIGGFLGFQKSRLGVISTISTENKPESAFVYYTFDENLNIYFATRELSRKYKNILKNKNVAFAMATENPPQTLQLEGIAEAYHDTKEQKELFQELIVLASAKHFSPPISQQSHFGALQFVRITPSWIRFGNFEVRKHEGIFQEVELSDNK